MVHNLIFNKQDASVEYSVIASKLEMPHTPSNYYGTKVHYLNYNTHGLSSLVFNIKSLFYAYKDFDTILIFGTVGCLALPVIKLFYKAKIIVNVNMLGYYENEFGALTLNVLQYSEGLASRNADVIIADNIDIELRIKSLYKTSSTLIDFDDEANLDTAAWRNIVKQYETLY